MLPITNKNKIPIYKTGIGIVVQVFKVDAEHSAFIERGGMEALPPMMWGATAIISFIKDPAKNWIEVSQRASLTGDLTHS